MYVGLAMIMRQSLRAARSAAVFFFDLQNIHSPLQPNDFFDVPGYTFNPGLNRRLG